MKIKPPKKISGTIVVPSDKSISHRAAILGAIAEGTTRIKNFLDAEDCLRTIEAFRAMGVKICRGNPCGYPKKAGASPAPTISICGVGLRGLKKPRGPIYCGNSGTTMRLLSGILAGQAFQTTLTGDESLSRRPMERIAKPLRLMGAKIQGIGSRVKGLGKENIYPPLTMRGRRLKAIDYVLPVASAQVKSCILLAGLYADGVTSVVEPMSSRDHTERMLRLFGVRVTSKDKRISIKGGQKFKAADIEVPADISSAAFFMVAASILRGSRLTIKAVGINPTRTGILDVLKAMGADIRLKVKGSPYAASVKMWGLASGDKQRLKGRGVGAEPAADLIIKSANLKSVTIKDEIIPRLIDELPIIMVAATQAKGTTKIQNAKELRMKETDRIKSMVWGLKKMGVDISVRGDDIYIKGPVRLKAARLKSFGDHRTAMSFAIAGLVADGETIVEDTDCICTSFPDFKEILANISQ